MMSIHHSSIKWLAFARCPLNDVADGVDIAYGKLKEGATLAISRQGVSGCPNAAPHVPIKKRYAPRSVSWKSNWKMMCSVWRAMLTARHRVTCSKVRGKASKATYSAEFDSAL